jgi:glycosyltransferase involved in cell wall biosynthesis
VLVIGVSSSDICGVRQYSDVLSSQLASQGFDVIVEWGDLGRLPCKAGVDQWLRSVGETVATVGPDVILFHYSVFTLAWRGIPTYVVGTAAQLKSLNTPVVAIFHEYAYPWGRRGWRGFVQAGSQRLVLRAIARTSTIIIVTTPERQTWLRSRWWLPDRRTEFVPVFSTVPMVEDPNGLRRAGTQIAVFGFGAEQCRPDLVTRAVGRIYGSNGRLVLIGQPGPDSGAGRRWSIASHDAGCEVEFTGELEPAELSRELANATILLSTDHGGPTPRRTTLAAALCHGKAVVALDGKETWEELRLSQAVALVPAKVSALVREIGSLQRDAGLREALEARARSFYEKRMSADVVAGDVSRFLLSVVKR